MGQGVFDFIESLAPWIARLLVTIMLIYSIGVYIIKKIKGKKEEEDRRKSDKSHTPTNGPLRKIFKKYGRRLIVGLAVIITVKTGFQIAHLLDYFDATYAIETIIMSILALALVIINEGLEIAIPEENQKIKINKRAKFLFIGLLSLALLTAFLCWLGWLMKHNTYY